MKVKLLYECSCVTGNFYLKDWVYEGRLNKFWNKYCKKENKSTLSKTIRKFIKNYKLNGGNYEKRD